jgi:hypothetical protein
MGRERQREAGEASLVGVSLDNLINRTCLPQPFSQDVAGCRTQGVKSICTRIFESTVHQVGARTHAHTLSVLQGNLIDKVDDLSSSLAA